MRLHLRVRTQVRVRLHVRLRVRLRTQKKLKPLGAANHGGDTTHTRAHPFLPRAPLIRRIFSAVIVHTGTSICFYVQPPSLRH